MEDLEGPTRTIIFRNSSFDAGSVCLFRSGDDPATLPTAWLTKPAFPTTIIALRWNVDDLRSDYRITFGRFAQGDLPDAVSIANAVEILFPPGVFVMTAEYLADRSWRIRPLYTEEPPTDPVAALPPRNR